jgi:hypothetical protein
VKYEVIYTSGKFVTMYKTTLCCNLKQKRTVQSSSRNLTTYLLYININITMTQFPSDCDESSVKTSFYKMSKD